MGPLCEEPSWAKLDVVKLLVRQADLFRQMSFCGEAELQCKRKRGGILKHKRNKVQPASTASQYHNTAPARLQSRERTTGICPAGHVKQRVCRLLYALADSLKRTGFLRRLYKALHHAVISALTTRRVPTRYTTSSGYFSVYSLYRNLWPSQSHTRLWFFPKLLQQSLDAVNCTGSELSECRSIQISLYGNQEAQTWSGVSHLCTQWR